MLVANSPLHKSGTIHFNSSYKNLWYKTKVKYFPFSNKTDFEKTHIEDILTPLAHIEFEVKNIDKSIYHSYWLMSYHFMPIIEEHKQLNINMICGMIVKELDFFSRIDNYILESSKHQQLSLF